MKSDLLPIVMTQAWQIAVLAVVVALIVRFVAKNRPHLAHALWLLVLLKCLTPPVWGHSLGMFSQLQAIFPFADVPSDDALPFGSLTPEASLSMVNSADTQVVETEPEPFPPLSELSGTSIAFAAIPESSDAEVASALPEIAMTVNRTQPLAASPQVRDWTRWTQWTLLVIVAGATTTLSVMIVRCLLCLRTIYCHRTNEFDDILRNRVLQLSQQLRLRRIPRVVVSDVLFGPAVFGFFRHTIVLPRCLLDNAEGREVSGVPSPPKSGEKVADRPVEGASCDLSSCAPSLSFLVPILTHELLHIRRGDLRTGILQVLSQSLWWFHPAVWLSNRWLSREAERCCDEQVIAELGCTPAFYARSLLSVIELKHKLQPIPVFPGMKPVEITTQRMERIMSLKNGLKRRTPAWCWLTMTALAFVVLPGAAGKTSPDEAAALSTNGMANVAPAGPPNAAAGDPQQNGDTSELRVPVQRPPEQKSRPEPATAHFTLLAYSVADLVVTEAAAVAADSHAATADIQRMRFVSPAAATAANPPHARAVAQDWLLQAGSNNIDFAPLVELIKASVAPESWEQDGEIATDDKTLALVIRQTQAVHDEIREVLSTLRSANDTQIMLTCRLVQADSMESQKWVDDHVKLHSSSSGARWSLLTAKKAAALTERFTQSGMTTLSAPRMLTIDGQTVKMSMQSDSPKGFNFGLLITPRMIAGDRFMNLEYGWTFDWDQVAVLNSTHQKSHRSTLESGQTLLLEVTDSAAAKTPNLDGIDPRTFLQITAERLRAEK